MYNSQAEVLTNLDASKNAHSADLWLSVDSVKGIAVRTLKMAFRETMSGYLDATWN